MAITPTHNEKVAEEIRRIYSEAEKNTIETVAKALEKDKDSPYWAQKKLRDLQKIRNEINKEIITDLKESNPKVAEAIEGSYKKGQKSATADMRKEGIEVETGFSATNRKAVQAIAKETVTKLGSSHFRILKQSEDVYRRAVSEASSQVVAGTQTRLQAAQQVLNQFANSGVAGYIDSAGRNWKLPTYAEMATRSASGRAALQGHMDRMTQNDRDLVIVSDHAGECELCRPWERRILSISGNSNKYPSVSQAISDGLYHPNCRHSMSAYVEGLTRVEQDNTEDPEGYQARQKQRYNERMVRKWKRRKAAAITGKAERKSKSKISYWQERQRKHLQEHDDLRRKYEREQINRAR